MKVVFWQGKYPWQNALEIYVLLKVLFDCEKAGKSTIYFDFPYQLQPPQKNFKKPQKTKTNNKKLKFAIVFKSLRKTCDINTVTVNVFKFFQTLGCEF